MAQVEGIAANYLTTLQPSAIPAVEQIRATEPEEQKISEPIDMNLLVTPNRQKRVSYKTVLETTIDTNLTQDSQSNIGTQSEHESQNTSVETVEDTTETKDEDKPKDMDIDDNKTETENEK